MLKYKYLLIDADNTLMDFDRAERHAFSAALAEYGENCTDERFKLYHEVNDNLWKDFERGLITKEKLETERFRIAFEKLGINISPVKFAASFISQLSLCTYEIEGAYEALKSLKSAGGRIYIITNGIERVQSSRWSLTRLKEFVDDIFVSEAIGAQKPSREYFDRVADRIPGFDSKQAVVIGDSPSGDIQGALNAGLDSIWFNPGGSNAFTGCSLCKDGPTYTIYSLDELVPLLTCPEVPDIFVTIPFEDSYRQRLAELAPNSRITYISPPDMLSPRTVINDEMLDELHNADIVLGNLPPKELANMKKLKWAHLQLAGVDSFVKNAVMPDGAVLCNSTGAYGQAISEHMLAAVLMMQKKLHLYRDNMREKQWLDRGQVTSINGSTVLVIGMGDIGGSFARLCKALGAYTIGICRTIRERPDYADELYASSDYGSLGELCDILLPRADVVAMALPGTSDTTGLFDAARIENMKNTALLANVGRGNAIDCIALAYALNSGKLGGAALDVTDPEPLPQDHPLWHCENALITPHISGFFHLRETYENIIELMLENVRRYMLGEELACRVDFETGYQAKS
ncbi:MAG: noncanonical pyrimidine nucleotidase, YjjG family [Clostridiales bacterium]|nr:noncanonical pyrimidine nucleotidase, YjjG family [Clostridiales bacterium]